MPAECGAQDYAVAESLVRYPRPALWHWVLPRQEAEWRRFLQLSGRGQRDPIYAFPDVERRTTYLRGAKLLYPGNFGVEVDAVVAHESAPIRLQGGDEAAAYLLAGIWPLRLSGLKIDTIASENVGNCQRLGFLFGIVGSKFRKVRNILDERWHEV